MIINPFVALCSLVLTVPTFVSSGAQSAAPVPGVYIGTPPESAVLHVAIDDLRMSPGMWASASISDDLSKVVLHWHFSREVTRVKQNVIAVVDQTIGVSGQATCIAAGINGELLVALKLGNGATRVQRYIVQAPLLTIGVRRVLKLVPKPTSPGETVFESSLVGQDMIKYMVRSRGVPGGYLVQFYDSKDLGVLMIDALPGTVTVIQQGATEALLDQDFSMFLAGEHSTAGYVYALVSMKYGFLESSNYYLIDSNKDGQFDFQGHLDASALDALNLGGLANWIEQQGTPVSELL